MFAIIATGGKQYRVAKGDRLHVEKLPADVGAEYTFDHVLLLAGENEAEGGVKVGQPVVAGATVKATVCQHGRGKKLIVFKFRRRKNYRRKQGHRQSFTEVEITSVG
jgi:large subunit ribosomal protein L21